MGFLDEYPPWGSPVVADIPLPPFANDAEHGRYVRMLQLHLAFLDEGHPSLPTIALSLALEPPRRYADADAARWLTPLELAVSLTSWFPAPWTPETLARTLARTHQHPPAFRGKSWRWLYDPDFTAASDRDGGWNVTRHERGDRVTDRLATDRDLVILWTAMFRDKFAFPLAHSYDEADLDALAPATIAVSEADITDSGSTYRTSWRDAREAALAKARREGRNARSDL